MQMYTTTINVYNTHSYMYYNAYLFVEVLNIYILM